jgi:hypothetical protein
VVAKKMATSLMMRLLANVGERALRTACPQIFLIHIGACAGAIVPIRRTTNRGAALM